LQWQARFSVAAGDDADRVGEPLPWTAMTANEIPLNGGNMNGGVVRVGDTVRRPAGPWTPAVHALLAHLHAAGFDGAPRPLGIDERGREILTFVPGTVAWPGGFHLLDDDGQLRRAVRLIRDFHDAVAGFVPPPAARWQTLMPADGNEIIAHNDLAPWNLVIGDRQWAFIDWDTAAPGTRLWDLAYALHGFVPLSANPGHQRADAGRRLRLVADAYGLTERQRLDIIPLLPRRTRAMNSFLAQQAAADVQPWARLWQEGHGDTWQADTEYITQREDLWHQALLG
jgi:Phosphotransferase enzyme family